MEHDWWERTLEEEMKCRPGLTEELLDEFRCRLSCLPHLPRLSDMELAMFLEACDLDIQWAEQTVDINCTVRSKSVFFSDRDPASTTFTKSRSAVRVAVSRQPSRGCHVLVMAMMTRDVTHYEPIVFGTEMAMVSDVAQRRLGLRSVSLIVDFSNMTLRHFFKTPLGDLGQLFKYIQDGLPYKVENIHVVNTNKTLMDTFMSIISTFVRASLLHKIKMHSGSEGLLEYLEASSLPDEYSGTGGPFLTMAEETSAMLDEVREFFKEEVTRKVDESLRPKKKRSGLLSWW